MIMVTYKVLYIYGYQNTDIVENKLLSDYENPKGYRNEQILNTKLYRHMMQVGTKFITRITWPGGINCVT